MKTETDRSGIVEYRVEGGVRTGVRLIPEARELLPDERVRHITMLWCGEAQHEAPADGWLTIMPSYDMPIERLDVCLHYVALHPHSDASGRLTRDLLARCLNHAQGDVRQLAMDALAYAPG